jgi:hypothetical protein
MGRPGRGAEPAAAAPGHAGVRTLRKVSGATLISRRPTVSCGGVSEVNPKK